MSDIKEADCIAKRTRSAKGESLDVPGKRTRRVESLDSYPKLSIVPAKRNRRVDSLDSRSEKSVVSAKRNRRVELSKNRLQPTGNLAVPAKQNHRNKLSDSPTKTSVVPAKRNRRVYSLDSRPQISGPPAKHPRCQIVETNMNLANKILNLTNGLKQANSMLAKTKELLCKETLECAELDEEIEHLENSVKEWEKMKFSDTLINLNNEGSIVGIYNYISIFYYGF